METQRTLQDHSSRGRLLLADGDIVEGISFGAVKNVAGEVVFNTGMVGYPEALTDPSYRGQILILTTPMVGNYGVPPDTIDEHGLPKYFEGREIHVAALIVTDYSVEYSHWNAAKSLSQWLKESGVPALYGVDTRRLTKRIRDSGAQLGKILFNDDPQDIPFDDPNQRHLVREVSIKSPRVYNPSGTTKILAFDCGIKYNIIRYFINELGVCLIVVPYDYPLEANPQGFSYDGIFISNGPGDPTKCTETITSLAFALTQSKPIFGICLGNQLLCLAAGGRTYKMKFGNRGMNQPAIDLRTSRCYITSQNHGFAVDHKSLPKDWQPLFLNANDLTNEGIIHTFKPFFSVQFHPEAAGGPLDTAFLFQHFLDTVRGIPSERLLISPEVYERSTIRKVLLVGSGGLSIGQAGEFDYSGSQAIKALKEEGLEVILINPNVATVQTSKNLGRASADRVYFLPIRPNTVEDIIKKERPDGILVSMGGQTALNVGIELYRAGVFEKYGVRVLGTPIKTIIATEDREIFSQHLQSIGERLAKSASASSVEEAKQVAASIGYPVLVRAAFALGGLGSGFAENEQELIELCHKGLALSSQLLIDQDLRGWKEIEYEVVRDGRDNCITVCNMENFDPLGVHTGDSIVIAPSQTLSNSEYFKLRATSLKVIRSLGVVGECNIQYALDPSSEDYCIVEVNARLSRSSALASKATGYPLAYVATKLSLGKDLVSIRNAINKQTTACFEPSLDYCVVKMPRWDLSKFHRVSTVLGSAMSSVGEVMAIGKTFEEAIQKAVRMVTAGVWMGLDGKPPPPLPKGDDSKEVESDTEALEHYLRVPTDRRLFFLQYALESNRYDLETIHRLTRIDRWFLARLQRIADLKHAFTHRYSGLLPSSCKGQEAKLKLAAEIPPADLWTMKKAGFSDGQLARYLGTCETIVRAVRQDHLVRPFVQQIDTLAGEVPAETNYLYFSYHASEDDKIAEMLPCGMLSIATTTSSFTDEEGKERIKREEVNRSVVVLGCGAYSIGSSVEFDWCAVSAVRQLRALGDRAAVINFNPETVSTDFDESDALYFEELTVERVLDVVERERAIGVMVSVGGQIANNLALPLHRAGVNILGTSAESIDRAEDRHRFSALLDSLKVDQPAWSELTSYAEAVQFAKEVGFPVLVRPSFVLSGAAMAVATTEEGLRTCLQNAEEVSADRPVVLTKFIINAKEIEFDGVADHGKILNYAISEHIENAGVHSGDATLVLPAQRLYTQTVRTVKHIAAQISAALKITGPFNLQLLARGNAVKVIECNLRASRTFPFISKTLDANFVMLATRVMRGQPARPYTISLLDLDYVAVKAPIFSFTRLRGADPTLGVEMASTGEVACFGRDVREAYLQALLAANFNLPERRSDHFILLSIAEDRQRMDFLESARELQSLGFQLAATPGTAEFYRRQGLSDIVVLEKPSERASNNNDGDETEELDEKSALRWIRLRRVDLVINLPEGTARRDEVTAGYRMRRAAVDYGISLLTNLRCAVLFVEALAHHLRRAHALPVLSVEELVGHVDPRSVAVSLTTA